jgi:ATP-dependent protease HslVU (ClpYQ) ATPase subunit
MFPEYFHLQGLTHKDLYRILTKPENIVLVQQIALIVP